MSKWKPWDYFMLAAIPGIYILTAFIGLFYAFMVVCFIGYLVANAE